MPRILIVDDDRTIHSVLSYFFDLGGFQVESAFNGNQALELARSQPPELLILDVNMPIKDGWETLHEWKQDQRLKHIPVIMLTSSNTDRYEHEAIGMGATHYLTKPFTPSDLVHYAQSLIPYRTPTL